MNCNRPMRLARACILAAVSARGATATGALAQGPFCSTQRLVASDGAPGDFFGNVALSGDTAVVGATSADAPPLFDSGAAYVYVRQGTAWIETSKLVARDEQDSALFGSVAIDGDTIVVGSMTADAPVPDSGAAYVFERSAGAWTQTAKLVPPDPLPAGWFGRSVAISGDTIAVGASGAEGAGGSSSGAVYVFERSGATWTLQAKLIGVTTENTAEFGWSVALDGDVLVAGDPSDVVPPFPGGPFRGRAFVFRRSGGTWTLVTDFVNDVPSGSNSFGWSVAVDADTLVVGDHSTVVLGAHQGAAFVYREVGGAWALEAKLVHPTSAATGAGLLAWAVAIEGDRLLLAAPFWELDPIDEDGMVFVYERTGTNWRRSASLRALTPPATPSVFRWFGSSVALSGQLVLVGAVQDDASGSVSGAAYAFGPSPHVRYCFGDGTLATPCPCAPPDTVPSPSGAPDAGCAASFNLDGGRLTACGSVTADRVRFHAELRSGYASFAYLVKGDASRSAGVASGDGLRCVDGQMIRFGGHMAGTNGDPYGFWTYPNAVQTLPVSLASLQAPGQTSHYQLLYRNAEPGFCNPSTYNLTNAVAIAW